MAKVMISMPDELLAAVDGKASSESRSRSELIREALRRYLVEGRAVNRKQALDQLRAAFKDISFDAEEVVRAERNR